MDLNEAIADACRDVPGLVRAALALVPDGFLLGSVGEGNAFDHEPLVRSAVACLASPASPLDHDGRPSEFIEYAFVTDDEIVVIEAGRRSPRLALVVSCRRETNLAFVVSSARHAILHVEAGVDLGGLELQ